MSLIIRTISSAILGGAMAVSAFAQAPKPDTVKKVTGPTRFEKDIASFEAADRKQPPPPGAIVCVGSSSMRGWHKTIAEDLAPLTVIPRGFGGSTMADLLYYTDRVVLACKPRAIVVYEGDNDIASGTAPEKLAESFHAFFTKVHEQLPECRIYVLSIKPSVSRWRLWPKMKEANRLIAADCATDKRLTFVDVASPMLDDAGNPRQELFQKDKLHMVRAGYELWRDTLKPVLLAGELESEPKRPE